MTRITELPGEIILHITSYLEFQPLPLTSKPFGYWPAYIGKHIEGVSKNYSDIRALARTCKHMWDVLFPAVYTHFNVLTTEGPARLYDAVEANNRLGFCIVNVYFSNNKLTLEQTQFIFFLPNIRTVYFRGWSDWHAFEETDESMIGDSPVTHLYLPDCGSHEAPLRQLLSWPKALKELWYEASQVEWSIHLEGEEAVDFTCSAVSRALKPLTASLEKLVFTRTDPNHEGLYYTDAVDLREFEKLRELSIHHVLLCGYDRPETIWENMPRSLEKLEVWYDDSGFTNFLITDVRAEWLFGILREKKEHFPRLGGVRVVSLEWYDVDQDEELGGNGAVLGDGDFRPPPEMKAAFGDAGVSYSIHLHEDRQYKEVVDGGLKLDEDWDEKEIVYPRY